MESQAFRRLIQLSELVKRLISVKTIGFYIVSQVGKVIINTQYITYIVLDLHKPDIGDCCKIAMSDETEFLVPSEEVPKLMSLLEEK